MEYQPLRLLVVDDSLVSRMIVRAIIRDHFPRWAVVDASNQDQALAAAREGVQLAIVDLNLGLNEGERLIAELGRLYPELSMAILVIDRESLASQEEGKRRYYQKPITTNLISEILLDANVQ